MEQIWERIFLNAFLGSSVKIVSGLNILAAESFLHLAVPAEAWPKAPPPPSRQGTCTVLQALQGTV